MRRSKSSKTYVKFNMFTNFCVHHLYTVAFNIARRKQRSQDEQMQQRWNICLCLLAENN
jgi:hypothetical protein